MAEKKKILYIVEAMGGGVFTYIVELANELVSAEWCGTLTDHVRDVPSGGRTEV